LNESVQKGLVDLTAEILKIIKSKTIEYYKKLLELWKDADPGITGFEDVKKRVAGVKEK